jgi:hypothetical protein
VPSVTSNLYHQNLDFIVRSVERQNPLPFLVDEQLPMLRILTDRDSKYCGCAEAHVINCIRRLMILSATKTKARDTTGGIAVIY